MAEHHQTTDVPMMCQSTVSDEELQALLHATEINSHFHLSIKSKIVIRSLIVIVLLLGRMLLVMFFPERHVVTFYNGDAVFGISQITNAMLFRIAILTPFFTFYLFSCWRNLYFRSMTVLSLILYCSIFWSDVERYSGAFLQDPSAMVIFTLLLRLLALYMLVLNYFDIRR